MFWYEIQKVVALQLHNARWAFKIATVLHLKICGMIYVTYDNLQILPHFKASKLCDILVFSI